MKYTKEKENQNILKIWWEQRSQNQVGVYVEKSVGLQWHVTNSRVTSIATNMPRSLHASNSPFFIISLAHVLMIHPWHQEKKTLENQELKPLCKKCQALPSETLFLTLKLKLPMAKSSSTSSVLITGPSSSLIQVQTLFCIYLYLLFQFPSINKHCLYMYTVQVISPRFVPLSLVRWLSMLLSFINEEWSCWVCLAMTWNPTMSGSKTLKPTLWVFSTFHKLINPFN